MPIPVLKEGQGVRLWQQCAFDQIIQWIHALHLPAASVNSVSSTVVANHAWYLHSNIRCILMLRCR